LGHFRQGNVPDRRYAPFQLEHTCWRWSSKSQR